MLGITKNIHYKKDTGGMIGLILLVFQSRIICSGFSFSHEKKLGKVCRFKFTYLKKFMDSLLISFQRVLSSFLFRSGKMCIGNNFISIGKVSPYQTPSVNQYWAIVNTSLPLNIFCSLFRLTLTFFKRICKS